MVVIICALSVLPWIGMGDFSTKGEPREAAVAISMLESGNWILPEAYANEFAYKPPMAHWLMAAFSLPQGYVSEFTARLPSALAFIVLVGFTLFFFGERIKFQEAFIATLLLLTCFEIHRAGMTTRVDMLLTMFMVLGLYMLYRWENRLQLKGLPIAIPFLLGCAALTKGPAGIILPLFVFGVYLLILGKHRLLTVFKVLLYTGVSSCFLPLIWYTAAWKQGGDAFLDVVTAENFGRFFHINNPDITYDLGHENGVWYNFITLLAGFIPWTLFFCFSLFGQKFRWPEKSFKQILKDAWTGIRSMEKIKLFSLAALVCILFFYSIPSSKRSVYLMPAYPFIAIFLARYTIYITEYRMLVTRIFAGFLALIITAVLLVVTLAMTGAINPVTIVGQYTDKASVLDAVKIAASSFDSPCWVAISILPVVLVALITAFYQMRKKINIKMLYATIFLIFSINLVIDGVVMRGVRKGSSSRLFAERILKEYPLHKNNTYVMNNLKQYHNLYGLNFYMKNIFRNFEEYMPDSGYFLSGEKDMEKVIRNYGDTYTFDVLACSERIAGEVRQKIILAGFVKKRYVYGYGGEFHD
ncbi:MAG: glycosyltransferase family 39 protein [Tannerellaceae bacterium]|jgi:4-amino-4-deoxy-L-arabinose transferase-like glycosyltransferase|nr:glycosyltransferase family 39 protein [Tannerellaceae bacterium]